MEIISLLIACLVLGVFAGVTAGLLGIGGGLIIVPILAGLFAVQGFAADVIMPLAVGTSLMTILFTSLSSMRAHQRRGAVHWPVMLQLSAGILIGGTMKNMHRYGDVVRAGLGIFVWYPGILHDAATSIYTTRTSLRLTLAEVS